MLLLQFLPLPVKRLEVLHRLLHFIGAMRNALFDQLAEPITRGL